MKTRKDFIDFMWSNYPNNDQIKERTAMLDAYDFLTGVKDSLEKQRNKLRSRVRKNITNDK